ncbi:unnamed protein product [Ceutorhynchus assimilis]|uniref:Nose resistant-to-fluoxetine protein N-terminal domain-containing protein n=1 Tax=Ceutorhynchus assimilis TaxID=467358 RepID=A0A9N9QMP4_9CUCU|nr:unnamed protein product [Ceutorhynchus assimilis]
MPKVRFYAILLLCSSSVIQCKFQDNICISPLDNKFKNSTLVKVPLQPIKLIGKTIFDLWRSFPVDIFSNVTTISQKCQKAYQMHLEGAQKNDLNSLKIFDATAKPGSGLLSGNINQYGHFDECMEVPDAQYCLALLDFNPIWTEPLSKYKNLVHAHFNIKETFADPAHRVPGSTFVRWGFCLPEICTEADLINALDFKLGIRAKVKPNMCQPTKLSNKILSFGDYLARAYFVFIALMVAVSTLNYGKYKNDTLWKNFVSCFAIQKTYKKLTTLTKNKNEYESLHGVRCLSAISLLMAHKTMASLFNPYINKTWMAETQAMKWSILGRNAIIYTDCFLLISGLLNANAILADLEKFGTINFREKVINRLFRILPGLFTVILFCTYILPSLGSGPQWPIVIDHHSHLCKANMWRNFLFIHNYFGFENMCLTHTHQLGIDMQLFLITPIYVYFLWKRKILGFCLIIITSLVSMCLRFYKTFYYNLSHVVHFGIPISRMFDTADHSYILPSHRATIYLIGVVLAWLLRNSKNNSSLSKSQILLIWSIIYIVGLTTWFAPVSMSLIGYEYNNLQAAIYGAIYPFTWGIAVAWVIYAVENGFGSWFSSILRWQYFQIFTKIAYSMYLVQFPVFFFNVGVNRHVGEFKNYMMLPPVETAIIFLLATILTLFIEMPFQDFHKTLISKYS